MINKFNRNLQLGYGFSIFTLVVVGMVSWLTLHRLQASNRAVTHNGEVIRKLEQLLSTIKDAETGQRGYLLSGQEKYLEPYNGAYRHAEILCKDLKSLTADNSQQQVNVGNICLILQERLAVLHQLVEQKKRGQPITVEELDQGKAAMDSFRNAVDKAEREEQALLSARMLSLDHYNNLAPMFIIIALVLALLIATYSYRNVVIDYRGKERLRHQLEQSEEETQALNEELTAANEEITASMEELERVNDSLEQRVAERTKALHDSEEETQALNEELTAINEELSATNEELKSANEELRSAHERSAKLAAIVESSDDAIIGKDLNGIVTAWNRGAQQIFGYKEEEMLGRSILTLIPEDLQHEEPMILGRLRNGEKIDHYETIRRTSDGRLIDVSLTISPIRDLEGDVIGVSKIARDITEKKRDEQRKSDFIGMASHELKTPLTSLIAMVQVLQLRLRESPDTLVTAGLNKVALQARKMTSLINGFLNVSRLESGKLAIEKSAFDLTDLIREQIGDIRMTVSQHQFIFEPFAEIRVTADRDKIGSVISNLLSNAAKYSSKGRHIIIRCERHNHEVWVSVQDEGIGISKADQDKLFERYYRVQNEQTKQIAGFGVGLYLSAEIIQRHDGRIWVTSEKGQGATFYFCLPLTV